MQKTTFTIARMDCPTEEQMIRMKLSDQENIIRLDFEISDRSLTVYHTGKHDQILQRLDSLGLDTSVIDSVAEENVIQAEQSGTERKLLRQVLAINLSLFVIELFTGILSNSMGLVADSMDMLADSIVYALALFAVGGSLIRKKVISASAGYFQLVLAIAGLIEVIRRFAGLEQMPVFQTMIVVSVFALFGNGLCLYLMKKNQSKEVHMQASMIFTSNDVIVNLGVILAGGLVYLTNSKYPDLLIGLIVFFIVGWGALKILKLSK